MPRMRAAVHRQGHARLQAIERILDEHSAWIARPSPEVTKAVAIAATVAAHRIIDEDRANHEAPLLAALKTIVDAGDCTVESIREGRDAIARAEGHASVSPERSDHKAVVEALRKFVAYYPNGINPELDDAYGDALDALASLESK